MTSRTDPDVVVVGGGPSGSVCALQLARLGWRVILLDRACFPRPKACGECVNPGAVAALARLGLLTTVEGLEPARLDGWRIETDAVDVSGEFGGAAHGFGLSRQALDHALLTAAVEAGVELLEGVRVVGVRKADAPGLRPTVEAVAGTGSLTLRPRLVVGADGLRSVVVRSLGLVTRRPRVRRVSVSLHLTGAGLPVGRGRLVVAHGITLGLAPLEGGVWNATAVTGAGAAAAPMARDPVGFVLALVKGRIPDAADVTLVSGPWTSGPFDWPVRQAWAPGVVLVGDAAGYFDPFTGQGIYRALRTAELAAPAAHAVLTGTSDGWGALAEYDRRRKAEVRWRLGVQRIVDVVMTSPGLRNHLLPVLERARALDGLIRLTGDVAHPATVPASAHP